LEKIQAQKKKILIGLGAFVGILILAGAVFGIYKYAQKQIPLEPTEGPTPEIATPTPDPIVDWKTYTNTKYGYSIKYPQEWFIEEKEDLTKIYNRDPNIHKFERIREISSGVFDYSIEDFIFDVDVVENVTREPNLAQKNSIDIGGMSGIRGILTGGEGEKILMAYLVKNNKTYNFYGRPADSNNKDIFNLILSTSKFLEEETPSPTPQLNHVPTLSTTDWKTISNNSVSFKIPPGAICDNDNLCTKVTYTWDYQGHPISSYIYVGVSDYQGESIKERFLEKNTEVVDCRPIYEEVLFGNVKALQIAIENGYCQGSSGGIVAVVGNKLVIIGGGLGYDPETKVIDRWPIRDTIISTLRMQ